MELDKKTIEACLNIAKGCHDYNGGYHDKTTHEIYHHGIQTVINALEGFSEREFSDMQVAWLHSIGKNQ